MTTTLPTIIAEYFNAVNSSDTDHVVSTFAADAYVNDHRTVFDGRTAIHGWVANEIVGDNVTVDVLEVTDHYGDTIVRGRYDGTYDKTNLPDELILTHYFSVRDDKIVSLIIIFTQHRVDRPSSMREPKALRASVGSASANPPNGALGRVGATSSCAARTSPGANIFSSASVGTVARSYPRSYRAD